MNNLVVTREKTMFGMEWVCINGRTLCSLKEAKEAVQGKSWKIKRWCKQSRFSNVAPDVLEEVIYKFLQSEKVLK